MHVSYAASEASDRLFLPLRQHSQQEQWSTEEEKDTREMYEGCRVEEG